MQLTRWRRKYGMMILLAGVTWGVLWRPPVWIMTSTSSSETRLFTIGIPTVRRMKASYLFTTLQSLVTRTTPMERLNTTIVICVNDPNATYVSLLVKEVKKRYSPFLKDGFIHMIAPPQSYYPSLSSLKQTLGDAKTRVKWRSKQNLDYAFLMNYAYSKVHSRYYLQLEDDVIAVSGYIQKMKKYIEEQRDNWTMLDFSSQGFIGKLYKNEDISKLSYLLRSFYNEQPCDYLLPHFLNIMLQRRRYIRIPILFLHKGKYSSLNNTIRKIA